ncbi:MAG TPA: DUF5996 family protein [Bacteriovoracaceae bacterium]|nr:DUF5996 family protein [Bacteriovoracaceae bacterium]
MERWPALPFDEWKDTCETLHMWSQIVGKMKMKLSPTLNELWHVAFDVQARGLTTGPIPFQDGMFQVDFDFLDHKLNVITSQGEVKSMELRPRTVTSFYQEFFSILKSFGISARINTRPVETEPVIPFEIDDEHCSYDKEYVSRWWQLQLECTKVLQEYRSKFYGKSSPITFFWGSFDLGTTRYSGRPAPLPKGPRFYQLAEDQENFNCGFWPGNISASGLLYGEPAFYAYAYPVPEGFEKASIRPDCAYYDKKFGEFILKYEDVRQSQNPEKLILEFLESAYEVAANLGKWNRIFLENPAVMELR